MNNSTISITCQLILFVFSINLIGQNKEHKYEFIDSIIIIPEKFRDKSEVILLKKVNVNLSFEKDNLIQTTYFHQKIALLSNESIERNNRIVIPVSDNSKLIATECRVLLPDGMIITLNEDDILEETDIEKGIRYNYFAVKGLEKGCILEYLHVIVNEPELTGKTFFIQSEYPIVNVEFNLIYPDFLKFVFESYNSLPKMQLDDSNEDSEQKRIYLRAQNIPGLSKTERLSNWSAHAGQLRYKLFKNTATGAQNLNDYKTFAGNVYENLFAQNDKQYNKQLAKFCKNISTSGSGSIRQIQEIEAYVKNNIKYNPYFNENKSPTDIFKSRQANQVEFLRLFIQAFKEIGLENIEVALTNNRFQYLHDKKIESHELLNEILFYFPDHNIYVEPCTFENRAPIFDHKLGHNYGLFISERSFGGTTMGVGIIKFIELSDTMSHDHLDIVIDFQMNIDEPIITSNIRFGGYTSSFFQPIQDFVSVSDYEDILKDIGKNYASQGELLEVKSENDGLANLGKSPFILSLKTKGSDLLEKAGDKYLFKIGETIGKQIELYQEEKRQLPVEIDYPHHYTRILKVILPDGYNISNPDVFTMNHQLILNEKIEAAFTSNYELKGRELIIENYEFYNQVKYPIELFETYKEVINAAADFNKITIILSPEE